ncbi:MULTISPECIES: AEC family transporter [unclassified Arthrobacter]|uniref:AEC family transporter n=1 Tax=unclassified Arthrobacter TaxID=235627 RepID=UPI002DFC4DBC|nr:MULTISPECIES: AEC family transporter [unclassified Arthrobacter]MEC5192217.1 malonate transporter [Arthrobacter sp. MP_M4]MEC5203741.1 malonate transporter [Arthrobacter sp. MP_M7]
MLGVLAGFSVVWCIILVGMFVGRRGILGENARSVLSALTFFVASPALLFETLSKAKLNDVFAAPLLVTAAGAIVTASLFFVIVRFLLGRPLPESLVSSMGASLANSANLGIPIAVFVLGDAGYVAPLLIFQLAFFTPLFLMALDATTSTHRTTPLGFGLMILRNPMIVGSGLGLLVAGTGWQVPELVMQPIHLIGGAAIPAMLIAFGMSLNGSRPLQATAGRRLDTLLASGFKLIVHPALAFLFARFGLGMADQALFAVVVTSALPTAQNVFVVASRYQTGLTVAKDTVLITTIVAVPAMICVALLLT